MTTHAQRLELKDLMDYLWLHRVLCGYPFNDERTHLDASSWALSQAQRRALLAHGGRTQDDCSQMDAWLLKAVGLWPWASPGYTGSHLATLLPVYFDPRNADVGAIAVFGPGTGHHEAMVYKPDPVGGNPLMQSHGRAGVDRVTLQALRISQTAAGHPGVRMCSIAGLP
jgi:hypothetical protein